VTLSEPSLIRVREKGLVGYDGRNVAKNVLLHYFMRADSRVRRRLAIFLLVAPR